MNKKAEIGITLIALVITIIILLILAGVTIAQLTGNGLFEKAKLAAEESKYANAAEKVKLAVNASYDESGKLNDNFLKENLNKIDGIKPKVTEVTYDLTVTVDGYEFLISEYGQVTALGRTNGLPENTPETDAGTEVALKDGWAIETVKYIKTSDGTEVKGLEKVATVYAVSDGKGNSIPVPYGFYYVGGTLSTGVVISDDSRDKNKYAGITDVPDGAVYKEDGTAKQIIYNVDGTVKTNEFTADEEKTAIVGNQFVWIPCSVSNYTKYDWGYKNSTGWDTSTNTAEKTQIEKYGGFYIGRYEAGTSNITFANNYTLTAPTGTSGWLNGNYVSSKVTSGKITSKAGEIPYFHADYPTAVEMSEKMYKEDTTRNKSVTSGLITGTMWDVALNFVSSETDKSVSNASNSSKYTDLKSSPWGNYNSDTGLTYTAGKGRYIAISNGSESGSFTKSDTSYHYGIRTTAFSEDTKKNNIYDLAGNLWEWTQEMCFRTDNSNVQYNFRGGSFNDASTTSELPVCSRYGSVTWDSSTILGFRAALYIK